MGVGWCRQAQAPALSTVANGIEFPTAKAMGHPAFGFEPIGMVKAGASTCPTTAGGWGTQRSDLYGSAGASPSRSRFCVGRHRADQEPLAYARGSDRAGGWGTGAVAFGFESPTAKAMGHPGRCRAGYTLLEVVLVIGLLLVLSAMVFPNLLRDIESRRLPASARDMRSMLTLVRANAMYDGKRYRIRFADEDEIDHTGEDRQPIIERESDPFREPDIYTRVSDPWAQGETFLRDVWSAQVRLGRPTLEKLEDERLADEEQKRFEETYDEFEDDYPPLIIEPDGTSEWVTFVITDAPRGTAKEDLEVPQQIEVIMDGMTGLIWLQRPFYDEELDMFKEHGWPPVLRRDFTRSAPLTEEDVLEIQETAVRR